MACTSCVNKQGQCDVCLLVDADESFKLVTYCKVCNANICLDCNKNWLKRSKAYFLKKIKSFNSK